LKDLEHVLLLMMLFDDESTDNFNNRMELYLVAGNRYFKARTSIPNPLEFAMGWTILIQVFAL
jgi:hypothetical protein